MEGKGNKTKKVKVPPRDLPVNQQQYLLAYQKDTFKSNILKTFCNGVILYSYRTKTHRFQDNWITFVNILLQHHYEMSTERKGSSVLQVGKLRQWAVFACQRTYMMFLAKEGLEPNCAPSPLGKGYLENNAVLGECLIRPAQVEVLCLKRRKKCPGALWHSLFCLQVPIS